MRWTAVSLAALTLVPAAPADLILPSRPPAFPVASSFRTPGEDGAVCTFFPGPVTRLTPGVRCAGMRNPVTIWLRARGQPLVWHVRFSVNAFESVEYRGELHFGEKWWADRRGQSGLGRHWDKVMFRCDSRASGLTCRSSSGHGFWMGRVSGHRVF